MACLEGIGQTPSRQGKLSLQGRWACTRLDLMHIQLGSRIGKGWAQAPLRSCRRVACCLNMNSFECRHCTPYLPPRMHCLKGPNLQGNHTLKGFQNRLNHSQCTGVE